jgi:glycosyltransferase involved in cell wall biosynthesis
MDTLTVLLVNKFYHDRGRSGGVGRYLLQEEEDLVGAGWRVVPFATRDDDARPSPWDRYFVTARDYARPHFGGGAAADAASLLWNREAARSLEALLREVRPDVAHLHNIYHHLSPSILPVLRRHGIPVVMTLHDLRLLCPAIHMLRHGQVCERCKGGRFWEAVAGRCVKDSVAASALAALETAHQWRRRFYPRTVSRFLCPSAFYAEKYREWGYPADALQHLPNFVDTARWDPEHLPAASVRDSYLYFGRLSREKGLTTLLDAQALWEREAAATGRPALRLEIAGTGPVEDDLRRHAAALGLTTVAFRGGLGMDDLRAALAHARFSVLPSEWYENGPMAALESLAAGVPLVGTAIGGLPEMIVDGITGVVAPPRDPAGLFAALRRAATLPAAARPAARAWALAHADRGHHMRELMAILREVAASGWQKSSRGAIIQA